MSVSSPNPTAFQSILYLNPGDRPGMVEAPAYFGDLNLDQIVDSITAYRQEYNLKPFFYTPLRDPETIHYRHAVMQDIEAGPCMAHIKTFTQQMTSVRRYLGLAEKLDYDYHRKGWYLEAALVYCQGITDLAHNLSWVELKSSGLLAFREYLTNYTRRPEFQSLTVEAKRVKDGLSAVKYSVTIQTGRFSVRRYEGEPDYSKEVEKIFEKFKQGAVKDYLIKFEDTSGMNHIEAQILDFVSKLYPAQFAALDQFCEVHCNFVDEILRVFDREVQFYVAYLEFISDFKRKGLPFCYPALSAARSEVYALEAYDLALANSVLYTQKEVVCNDFSLSGPERVIVVSGPNQGGKTTFARMFGQLHHLASLGCPVAGKGAQLFLFDRIFTHFEREEDIRNLQGKLQDDLARVHHILAQATPDSILILNEIFASTTLQDAVFLSKEILAKVMELDLLCVWVTFLDELSSLSEKTISMVSAVAPENPDLRTFKVIRRPADGLAYANSIAKRHRLTYEQIKERIQQ